MPVAEKSRRSWVTIDNSTTIEHLDDQISDLVTRLQKEPLYSYKYLPPLWIFLLILLAVVVVYILSSIIL